MKKKIIIHYPLLIFFLINLLSILLLFYFYNNDFSNYVVFKTIVFIILLWIPYLISKILKLKIPSIIYKIYFGYIFMDLLFGKIFMFEKFTNLYNYVLLFIQGIIFFIFGLYVIRFLDDYGLLSFKILIIFSTLFSVFLSNLKEIFYYLTYLSFNINIPYQINNLIISFIGSIFIFILSIIDYLYYKQKYFLVINSYLDRKT